MSPWKINLHNLTNYNAFPHEALKNILFLQDYTGLIKIPFEIKQLNNGGIIKLDKNTPSSIASLALFYNHATVLKHSNQILRSFLLLLQQIFAEIEEAENTLQLLSSISEADRQLAPYFPDDAPEKNNAYLLSLFHEWLRGDNENLNPLLGIKQNNVFNIDLRALSFSKNAINTLLEGLIVYKERAIVDNNMNDHAIQIVLSGAKSHMAKPEFEQLLSFIQEENDNPLFSFELIDLPEKRKILYQTTHPLTHEMEEAFEKLREPLPSSKHELEPISFEKETALTTMALAMLGENKVYFRACMLQNYAETCLGKTLNDKFKAYINASWEIINKLDSSAFSYLVIGLNKNVFNETSLATLTHFVEQFLIKIEGQDHNGHQKVLLTSEILKAVTPVTVTQPPALTTQPSKLTQTAINFFLGPGNAKWDEIFDASYHALIKLLNKQQPNVIQKHSFVSAITKFTLGIPPKYDQLGYKITLQKIDSASVPFNQFLAGILTYNENNPNGSKIKAVEIKGVFMMEFPSDLQTFINLNSVLASGVTLHIDGILTEVKHHMCLNVEKAYQPNLTFSGEKTKALVRLEQTVRREGFQSFSQL